MLIILVMSQPAMPRLVKPSAFYQTSFIAAIKEAQALQSGLKDTMVWDINEMQADFDKFLRLFDQYEVGRELPEGYVNSSSFWLVKGHEYLGRASLRHCLNAHLRLFGGHIGYEISPIARKKGYATLLLRLMLAEAQQRGIESVLVNCDSDNIASRKVIEANGGVLEGEFTLDFHPKPILRYWIDNTLRPS